MSIKRPSSLPGSKMKGKISHFASFRSQANCAVKDRDDEAVGCEVLQFGNFGSEQKQQDPYYDGPPTMDR